MLASALDSQFQCHLPSHSPFFSSLFIICCAFKKKEREKKRRTPCTTTEEKEEDEESEGVAHALTGAFDHNVVRIDLSHRIKKKEKKREKSFLYESPVFLNVFFPRAPHTEKKEAKTKYNA